MNNYTLTLSVEQLFKTYLNNAQTIIINDEKQFIHKSTSLNIPYYLSFKFNSDYDQLIFEEQLIQQNIDYILLLFKLSSYRKLF